MLHDCKALKTKFLSAHQFHIDFILTCNMPLSATINHKISTVTSRGHIYTCWLKTNFSAGWFIIDSLTFVWHRSGDLNDYQRTLLWAGSGFLENMSFFWIKGIEGALVRPCILLCSIRIWVRDYLMLRNAIKSYHLYEPWWYLILNIGNCFCMAVYYLLV